VKYPLWFLAFPLPKKSGGLSGVPESRKTLRGKGATERKGRVCNRKPALKRTLRRRRAAKFVRSKRQKFFEKSNAMRFFIIPSKKHMSLMLIIYSFPAFCVPDIF
ncbi:MAG: hypothetical protein IJD42_01735, partial [Clostridia bacterium]|nr:hypothetical protein [Clostridia bacterium]